ncbi:hypothetical protein [Bradyrhizobium sp. 195]|uniref:hypothetical protein n=1 Tax=Bradyrhizobium sp. 195 TaxID=2782662 RepID=UPI0020019D83|nr:hypothetical protein [Bradyrhizobium sp. 195]
MLRLLSDCIVFFARDILDQHAYGDLELEAGQRQPAFAQLLADLHIEVLRNCAAETLTAILKSRFHDAASRQASISTRSSIWAIEQPQSAAHGA